MADEPKPTPEAAAGQQAQQAVQIPVDSDTMASTWASGASGSPW